MLPDTRIELVPIDTHHDKLNSFQKTVDIINDQNIQAIIGDDTDEATLSMAVLSAVNHVLHCSPDSYSPALSKKTTYPMTFRTVPISTC